MGAWTRAAPFRARVPGTKVRGTRYKTRNRQEEGSNTPKGQWPGEFSPINSTSFCYSAESSDSIITPQTLLTHNGNMIYAISGKPLGSSQKGGGMRNEIVRKVSCSKSEHVSFRKIWLSRFREESALTEPNRALLRLNFQFNYNESCN